MEQPAEVRMIPVARINILNPRNRDAKKFAQIAANIEAIGIKRPIVVSRAKETKAGYDYDLVCGQGRLESVIKMGCAEIPAIVVDISREESLLKSLIENLARRNNRMLEQFRPIAELRDKGYTNAEISRKIGMDETSVGSIIRLFDNGEERLLHAVDQGRIPISVATLIGSVDDQEAQNALAEAYETHGLRGKALLRARKVVEQRRNFGKACGRTRARGKRLNSDAIVKEVAQESKRHKLLMRKATICDHRLLFVVNAMRELLADENFRNLLRAEKLDTMPAYLSERMEPLRP